MTQMNKALQHILIKWVGLSKQNPRTALSQEGRGERRFNQYKMTKCVILLNTYKV